MLTDIKNSTKDQERELIAKVAKANQKLHKSEGNTVKRFIKLGKQLIRLKEVVKKKDNKQWQKYLKKEISSLSIRRAQRAMILAEKVDIESAPGLAFISQRKLLQLVSLLGDKPLVDVLQQRKIDCNLTDKDQDKISILKDKITSLIESLQKKKQEGRKKDPSTLLENAVNSLKQRFDDIENDSNCSNQLTTSTLEGIKEKLNRMLDKLEEMIQASG